MAINIIHARKASPDSARAALEPIVAEYERKLAERDETIAALERRLLQAAQGDHDTPIAILAQNISLEQAVAHKTAELEAEHRELTNAMEELRVAQSQLLQAQKMESIGQLAAGIAHEINTPTQYVTDNIGFVKAATGALLTLVDKSMAVVAAARGNGTHGELIGAVGAALKHAKLDYLRRQIPDALDQSLEGLAHIAKIVAAMKEFSHPSRGEKEAVDIREVITTTVTVARNEWKYVADLETHFEDELPLVPCLRDTMGQALLNLVVNAAHAIGDTLREGIKEKGRIVISAARVGAHLEIRITDDGTGIPVGVRDRIFDPFFTTKPLGKGTGQGLAIVYSTIVDKHQGEIRCESNEGVGTAFILRLPLSCEREACEPCK